MPEDVRVAVDLVKLFLNLGSDEKEDSGSPELKRAKRQDSAQPSPRIEHTLKSNFPKSKFLSGVVESGSCLSFRSVGNSRSSRGTERDKNSNHSLPTLEFNALPLSSHRLSLEVLGDGHSRDSSEQFERRASLGDIHRVQADVETAQSKNDRKTRVVASYFHHLKENQQLVGSDRGYHKALTDHAQPSHHTDDLESLNEPSNVLDGFGTGNDDTVKDTAKMKLGLSGMAYESGEDCVRKILMPAPLVLIGSRELYENWSTTNSFLEDDAPQDGLRSTEATEPTDTAPGNAGDSSAWHSHVEREYKNELEFSTLVTLAYVRVRDLTNTINQANSYLEKIDRQDTEELKETNELRSEIQAVFEERANSALEHAKWRSEFSHLYQQRKRVLSNLKSQAALAERSYFQLRKELEDLQNEPIITKPKRSWFSRLCAFIK